GYTRLKEVRDLFGIDANREIVDHVVTDVLFDLLELGQARREHVVVGDEEERLVLVLKTHPVLQRPDVVPNVKLSRRAVARQDALARPFFRLVVTRRVGLASRGKATRRSTGHGTVDASARSISSATSRPTSSRLPTQKWSALLIFTTRAPGIADRSWSALPN